MFGALVATTLCACSAPMTGPSLVSAQKSNDADAQLEFWHALGDRPMTSHDDAFHGILLYMDSADPSTGYADRVQRLKDRQMLPASFNRPAEEAIQRGTLAVMIAKVVHLRGGLMYTLCPSPRYATRELLYAGLFPPSTPNQVFSGAEYVGIIGRLEDYQRGDPADKPAAEMPSDTDKQ